MVREEKNLSINNVERTLKHCAVSFWYMPRDMSSRISWFYCMSALSGAFSGILAAGIAKMDGVGGYEGQSST